MIKEIEFKKLCWECSDGKRFDSEKDALTHEYHLIYKEFLDRGDQLFSSIGCYKILVINNKEELDLFKRCCENKVEYSYFVVNKNLENIFPFILIELTDDDCYCHLFYHIDEYITRLRDTAKILEGIVLKINQKLDQ